jgi:uncharacterized protein YhbP (UPF0306 family)
MPQEFLDFIASHHVLALACGADDEVWASSCFYAYDEGNFIIASDPDTRHMKLAEQNPKVAGAIHLQTREIGRIQGLQFDGVIAPATAQSRKAYYRAYPFARALRPKLWQIEITYAKLTDNRLGFGKKLEYKKPM